MRIVTVLTPTYNREKTLPRLYQSLVSQTTQDFTWLVVDDGSADGTEALISSLQEHAFGLRYLQKTNGGKHTAVNLGMAQVDTPLVFIVDSDDWLAPDAIECIEKYYEKYRIAPPSQAFCGFSFLRRYPDGVVNGKPFSPDERNDTYLHVRVFGKDTHADKAEVFFTDILRQYPFPEFPGEKFLGEDIVWVRLSEKYTMIHINQPIYIGDYQEDGLTRNRRKHNIHAPVGCFHRSKEFLKHKLPFPILIKNCLQVIVYGKFAGYSLPAIVKGDHTFLLLALYLPGLILYHKWKKDL